MLKKYLKSAFLSTTLSIAVFSANSAVLTVQGTLGAAHGGIILKAINKNY